MKLLKINGISVKINYFMLPVFIASVYFKYSLELLITLVVIIIHELSHCLVSRYYGIEILEIELFPFGGVAKSQNSVGIYPLQEMIIAIAGPASNCILLAIGILASFFLPISWYYIDFFIEINIWLGLFNLLPILPLDGGRILRAYTSYFMGIRKSTRVVVAVGRILCFVLFFIGMIGSMYSLMNILLVAVAVFLYFKVEDEKKVISYALIINIFTKKNLLFSRGAIRTKQFTALESTCVKKVFEEFSCGRYHIVAVVDTKGEIQGFLSESEVMEGILEYGMNTSLKQLINAYRKEGKA